MESFDGILPFFFFPIFHERKQLTVNDDDRQRVLRLILFFYYSYLESEEKRSIRDSSSTFLSSSSSSTSWVLKYLFSSLYAFIREFDQIRKPSLKETVHKFRGGQARLIIMRLSLDEGVKFETTIVLGRDSNSVTQSLSSKSIWRRRWSPVSLPIHRVTLSLSLSLLFALGRLLDGSMTTDGRSVVPRWIFTEHNAAVQSEAALGIVQLPLSALVISSRFSSDLTTLAVSLQRKLEFESWRNHGESFTEFYHRTKPRSDKIDYRRFF